MTHLSTKGSVGRKGELEERGRPRQNEGPFGWRPTPGAREGGTRAGRWRRTAPGQPCPDVGLAGVTSSDGKMEAGAAHKALPAQA